MHLSKNLFEEAVHYIPGGVNSPVRSFKSVGGIPFFTQRAHGAYLTTTEGHELIDYVGSWGPAIHGHNHPKIKAAIIEALEDGTSFGTPNPREVILAKMICEYIPSIQKVRMCNSGTEATLTAVRLARGYTRRNKILKFKGCYHGHVDTLLAKAGSGVLTFSTPDSAGIPESIIQHTILAEFNDFDSVEIAFKEHGEQLAAAIIEPYVGNCGLILPKPGFLEFLRKQCTEYGSLLIFDEVMTGFRIGLAGVQGTLNITPDLTTLAKILGAGIPVGALGGRAEIMDYLAPVGPVYQAGTLSGNPIAMAASIASLELLKTPNLYKQLDSITHKLQQALLQAAQHLGIPVQIPQAGSMMSLFFSEHPVENYTQALSTHSHHFKKLFHHALSNGVFLPPSPFESWFLGASHTSEIIEKTVDVLVDGLRAL